MMVLFYGVSHFMMVLFMKVSFYDGLILYEGLIL